MNRRDVVKGLATLPLMGALNPLTAAMANPHAKKRLIIDTHVETWNLKFKLI